MTDSFFLECQVYNILCCEKFVSKSGTLFYKSVNIITHVEYYIIQNTTNNVVYNLIQNEHFDINDKFLLY